MTQVTFGSTATDPPAPLGGNAICVAAMVFFATGFPAAEYLLQSWGAISLITARVVLVCLLFLPAWVFVDGWARVSRTPWPKALFIGAMGFGIGTVMLLVLQDFTDPVTAALVAATMPLSAVALEILFDGRRLSGNFVIGMVLVLIGGYLATGARLADGAWGGGVVFGLLATVLFAWGSRQTVKGLPMMSTLGQTTATLIGAMLFCCATLAVFLFFGWSGTHAAPLGPWGWLMLITYAWGAMGISQALWILGVRRLGIGLASFHVNATPFYVMLILLASGGTWDWTRAFGAAVLGAGVILSQRRRGARI